LSFKTSLGFEPPSDESLVESSKEYVGSGGKNANFAAILDGKGGQQNKQHNSDKDSPIPLIFMDFFVFTVFFLCSIS
jgi:hypothetical protein